MFRLVLAILFVRSLPGLVRMLILLAVLGLACEWVEDHSASFQSWYAQTHGEAYVPFNR
jgi:hypothetical protein